MLDLREPPNCCLSVSDSEDGADMRAEEASSQGSSSAEKPITVVSVQTIGARHVRLNTILLRRWVSNVAVQIINWLCFISVTSSFV